MIPKSLFVALMMSSVVLAGCIGSDDGQEVTGEEADPTKGAISGLLVDDNFRPVQLKEEWGANGPGEFQDTGFILVVETADRFETTENGEFSVEGLTPGTYTLQVAAEGHEAIKETVLVEANEKSSVTLEARRKANAANPVVTIEFSGFVPCATGGAVSSTSNCVGDLSGDAYRPGPIVDYREAYGTDAHYMVIEAVANQEGNYILVFREDDVTGSGGFEFARTGAADPKNPYMKLIVENSAVYGTPTDPPATYTGNSLNFFEPEHNPRFKGQNDGTIRCGPDGQEEDGHDPADYCSWPNAFPTTEEAYNPMEALVFFTDDEELPDTPAHGQDDPTTGNPANCKEGCGAGAAVAIKINYVISIYLGEPTPTDSTPEDDLNEYCVLCKGYLDEL